MTRRIAGAAVVAAALMGPPTASAAIQPGAQTRTDGAQCTSNFVYSDAAGTVYLGQAAHCASTGGDSDTNGCATQSLPLGTEVTVEGARHPATLAYSSWLQMQKSGEKDPDACAYNDLALVKLDPEDAAAVDPSIPVLGGPQGLTSSVPGGATVFSYGNSELRGGLDLLKPKRGFALSTGGGGWTHTVLTLSPGIPGDSGSGFVDRDGHAFGVLSTLSILPVPATNGVSDLSRMLDYANAKTNAGYHLTNGTSAPAQPFLGL